MKKIFCPKCDHSINIIKERINLARSEKINTLSLVCPSCTQQLRLRLGSKSAKSQEYWGYIIVIENVFGYKQVFPLKKGLNRIGRRNKDTATDIAILTSDPSMDRHHCLIKVALDKYNTPRWVLIDNDSRVGTFVAGKLLENKEQYYLQAGDVFTLGATSIIFSDQRPQLDADIDSERLD